MIVLNYIIDEYNRCTSISGKVAWVLLVTYAFVVILSSIYQLFEPTSFGFDDTLDEWASAWWDILIRQLDLSFAFAFFYVVSFGLTVFNTGRLLLATVLYWIAINHWLASVLLDEKGDMKAHTNSLFFYAGLWPGVIFVLSLLEPKARESHGFSWNPFAQLIQLWNKSAAVWGKVSIIFFHFFIVVVLYRSILYMIDPYTGSNKACIDLGEDEYGTEVLGAMVQLSATFTLFFILLAYLKGPTPWNIFKVTLFAVISYIHSLATLANTTLDEGSVHLQCRDGPWSLHNTVFVLGVALICAALEVRVEKEYSTIPDQPKA